MSSKAKAKKSSKPAKKPAAKSPPKRSGVALDAPVFSLLKRFRERAAKKEGSRVSMNGAVARLLKAVGMK